MLTRRVLFLVTHQQMRGIYVDSLSEAKTIPQYYSGGKMKVKASTFPIRKSNLPKK